MQPSWRIELRLKKVQMIMAVILWFEVQPDELQTSMNEEVKRPIQTKLTNNMETRMARVVHHENALNQKKYTNSQTSYVKNSTKIVIIGVNRFWSVNWYQYVMTPITTPFEQAIKVEIGGMKPRAQRVFLLKAELSWFSEETDESGWSSKSTFQQLLSQSLEYKMIASTPNVKFVSNIPNLSKAPHVKHTKSKKHRVTLTLKISHQEKTR